MVHQNRYLRRENLVTYLRHRPTHVSSGSGILLSIAIVLDGWPIRSLGFSGC